MFTTQPPPNLDKTSVSLRVITLKTAIPQLFVFWLKTAQGHMDYFDVSETEKEDLIRPKDYIKSTTENCFNLDTPN